MILDGNCRSIISAYNFSKSSLRLASNSSCVIKPFSNIFLRESSFSMVSFPVGCAGAAVGAGTGLWKVFFFAYFLSYNKRKNLTETRCHLYLIFFYVYISDLL